MTKNEEIERDQLFDSLDENIDDIRTITTTIKECSNGLVNLPNIGITVNNKFVEIVSFYRNNNMCFYSAELRFMISNYLLGLLDQGIGCLNLYTDILNTVREKDYTREQILKFREEIDQCVELYKAIDDKVFDFKFESDLQECLDIDVEYYNELGKIGGDNLYKDEGDETLEAYNEELAKFGISPISLKKGNTLKL